MADAPQAPQTESSMQKLFDSPFLLLFAGLVVMFGFYTVWGLIEIMTLPESKLP